MARLGAKEKLLFYPTPQAVVFLILSNITSGGKGTILDPCCGTGEALATLGSRLNLATFGNELDPQRFNQAQDQVGVCLNGAREFLDIEGQFSCLFDNPPYDVALGGERMELAHFQADLPLLTPGGLGIWVIPETILDFSWHSVLASNLSEVVLRRFPEPEYDRFKQVVIMGYKRQFPLTVSYQLATALDRQVKQGLPPLADSEFSYQLPDQASAITQFKLSLPVTGEVLAEAAAHGVQTTEAWESFLGYSGSGFEDFQPVLRLTSGHAAMTIAAGIVDGTEVVIDDLPHLIKGSTHKTVKTTRESEAVGDGTQTTIREREQLVQTITAFNLDNGSVQDYNSQDNQQGFSQFLITHQQALVDTIDRRYPPRFEPDQDMPTWVDTLSRVKAPGKLPGQTTIGGLLPAQQVRAAALAQILQTDKGVILIGEMGSGKSAISAAVAVLIGKGNFKTVIVCPSNIVHKWKRQAQNVLINFGVSVHIIGERKKQPDGNGKIRKVSKPVLDVIRAMEEDSPSILVMSYETAKNGARWQHAVATHRLPVTTRKEVVEVIHQDFYPYEKEVRVERDVTQVVSVLSCPDCGEVIYDDHGPLRSVADLGKRKHFCRACGGAMWQQIPFQYGGRVAIADFMNKQYAGQFDLILDEYHHTKGSTTDAGYAATDLISASRKVLAMTGTAYAGKASSIFFMKYRLFPWFRELYAYNEVQRFIEHHGLQETITTVKPSKQWTSAYGYNRENVRVKEIPGASPAMVTMLLNSTVFIRLSDMEMAMPPYTEERYPIALDVRLESGLDDLKRIAETAKEYARKGKPGLLSQWLYASLGWMDNPVTEALKRKNDEGEVVASYEISGVLDRADQLLDEPLAKDEALVEIIESELAQKRGVGVFYSQVNRRDWLGRTQKLLQQKGIYSEVLRRNTCKPEDREAWYGEFVKRCRAKGQEPVLLANGNLLKEGLDLVELPTLVETGIEYKINDLRQRDRRAWRLIQDRPCKVIFLYYEDSMQEIALRMVAAKLKAALMVDGNLADGLAAMSIEDGDLMNALMKAVSQGKRQQTVEWAGMEVASITPLDEAEAIVDRAFDEVVTVESEQIEDALLVDLPLFAQTDTEPQARPATKPRRKKQIQVRCVEVKKGVAQLTLF